MLVALLNPNGLTVWWFGGLVVCRYSSSFILTQLSQTIKGLVQAGHVQYNGAVPSAMYWCCWCCVYCGIGVTVAGMVAGVVAGVVVGC